MKILINGCGTVGRPLAYGLYDLGFKDVYVSVRSMGDNLYERNEKSRLKKMLKETGYNLLIVGGGDALEKFRKFGLNPIGYANEIVMQSEFYSDLPVIIDGTPNDKTAQTQKETIYDKIRADGWKGSVIYSGGSKYGIAPNYLGAPGCIGEKEDKHLLHKDVRNVSCNSTYLGKLFSILGTVINWEAVEFLNTDLFRRSRDAFEGQTKPLINVQYEPKLDRNEIKKTKYIEDVISVYPEINKVKDISVEPYLLPTEYAHLANTILTFKNPVPKIIYEIKEAISKAPYAILFDGEFLNMEQIVDTINIEAGVPDFQITAPIYWPLQLNDRQIKIVGLTPQMTIDRESKLTKIIEETGICNNFGDAHNYVLDRVNEIDTAISLKKFNKELQEILASKY